MRHAAIHQGRSAGGDSQPAAGAGLRPAERHCGQRGGTRPALAELQAKLKSQHRTLEDFLRAQSATQDDLRRQLAWNLVWEKYLARYVTAERLAAYFQEHRRELDGSRVSASQILLRPAPCRAGGGRVAREAGRRHSPAGDRGRDFIRRRGRKILGRGQREAGRTAGPDRPARGHGRGLFSGRLHPGSRPDQPAGADAVGRASDSLRRRRARPQAACRRSPGSGGRPGPRVAR